MLPLTAFQVTAALVILWMATNFFIKLIMLFFYRRIFVGRVFNIFNWVLIGLSILWFVYAILSWLLYCGKNFEANVEGGWLVCPLWGFDIQMGVFALDSFIDLCLLVLPIPFVSGLTFLVWTELELIPRFMASHRCGASSWTSSVRLQSQ